MKVDVTSAEQLDKAVQLTVKELGGVDILCCFAGVVGCTHAIDMRAEEWKSRLDINTTGSFLSAQAVARWVAYLHHEPPLPFSYHPTLLLSLSPTLPTRFVFSLSLFLKTAGLTKHRLQQHRHLITSKTPGTILFLASISAHRTNYPQPQAAYNASKAALLSLKSSLAAEWAVHGIRVNSVSPGYMDTVLNEGEGLQEARRTWGERNPMGRMGVPEELTGVVVLLCSGAGGYVTGADFVVDGGQCCF